METNTRPWKWQEDGLTVTRGSAWSGPGCHDGCGVLLFTDKDGKLVKVEGDPENPYNQGRLCVRCLAVPNVTNHPDRLKYPMKRVGKRGENKWERITWDEAYDTIVKEFTKVKEEYGAESVIFCQGTGRDIAPYISRLAWSFGSPNWAALGLSGNACYLPRVAGCIATTGSFWVADCSQASPMRYDNPDYKIPECMAIWGNNPVVSNADGFYGHWVVDLMKRGTKLIVIDPRLTWLASKADLWLQIRPGTDAALALGMLNVIINEGLYDEDFVDKWCYGFEQLKERAQQYPVDKVSQITWIPEEKIIAAARLFANSKPSTVQWGLALDMTKEALPAGHAITALWSITGNIDVPGGMLPPPTLLFYGGGWGAELISEEQKAKRIGLSKYPLLQYGFVIAHSDTLAEQLHTGEPYPIKAAWVQTNNGLACMSADPKKMYAGLRKLDFVVGVDLFMTPTLVACADIILPAATYPEREGLRFGDGPQRGEAINKVTQIGECKSDMQINMELGKRWNPEAYPWDNVQDMFTYMLKSNGMDYTFQELREVAPIYPPQEYKRHEKGMMRFDGEIGFNTPTRRIELYSTFYEQIGLDPLPYFEEPTESPLSTPDIYEKYPLILTTGARAWGLFHSEHRQIPRLRAIHPDPTLQIHPEAAEKFGVKAGDWVWVENSMGRAKRKIEITPILHPRVVNADHAWWFPEAEAAEPNLYNLWDLAINQLVPFLPGKSGFGGNYKALLCRIYKVAEGEM
jgi:anaerobic selenocysteine-containing dehydrogenase